MSFPVPPSLLVIAELAPGLAGTDVFLDALALWREPAWRVAVVGRVSVGKSTLVNILAGRVACPTGLGGVTREATEVRADGDLVLIDTPGMDGAERVPPALDAAITGADAVVWVVDGLQPITETERSALAERVPPDMAVHVVVSRVDLVGEAERPQVLDRVRTLTAPWSPRSVQGANLREARGAEAPKTLSELTAPRPWPSRRRRYPMRAALAALRTTLDEIPPLADPTAVLNETTEAWRRTVRRTEATVSEEIRSGSLDHRALAERRFSEVARTSRKAFLAWLEEGCPFPIADRDLPALPLPDLPQHGAVDLVGGMGGVGSAVRTVRAMAGRWMMEGDLVLAEWVPRIAEDPEQVRARANHAAMEEAIRDAIDDVG